MAQEGDVLFFQTNDDGNIISKNGIIEMTGGFESAVYLSLFGGQVDYWGDIAEDDPDFKTKSETDTLIDNLPSVPANLRRLEQAAQRDLAWFISKRIANTVSVTATMPGVDRVRLSITITAEGVETTFNFTQNWRAQT